MPIQVDTCRPISVTEEDPKVETSGTQERQQNCLLRHSKSQKAFLSKISLMQLEDILILLMWSAWGQLYSALLERWLHYRKLYIWFVYTYIRIYNFATIKSYNSELNTLFR